MSVGISIYKAYSPSQHELKQKQDQHKKWSNTSLGASPYEKEKKKKGKENGVETVRSRGQMMKS